MIRADNSREKVGSQISILLISNDLVENKNKTAFKEIKSLYKDGFKEFILKELVTDMRDGFTIKDKCR